MSLCRATVPSSSPRDVAAKKPRERVAGVRACSPQPRAAPAGRAETGWGDVRTDVGGAWRGWEGGTLTLLTCHNATEHLVGKVSEDKDP